MSRRVSPDPLGLSGQTLLERYAVEAAIAQGGMAIIYRGRDLRLLRPICIKVFQRVDPRELGYRTAYDHFVQEAFALSQLDHPNTLRIYDFGYLPGPDIDEGGGPPFQISEMLEGGTLGQRIRAEGPLDGPAALELMTPIAGALAEAHARGIVHRDIKPSNILFGKVGDARIVKLADFGIAKVYEGSSQYRAEDTVASAGPRLRLYSPGWSAPEQIHGGKVGPAADVFALGLVLAFVLTGQPIFVATRADEALAERVDADAHVERFLRVTGLPEGLAHVVRCACRESLDERFAGVDELIAALRAAVSDSESLVTEPLPRAIFSLVPPPPEHPPTGDAPLLIVDPEGDGEVLVAGRRMRLVPLASGDQLDLGGDGPWLRSPARFRITVTPSAIGAAPRIHVKGLNCFVARAGARPTTAVDVDDDTEVHLMAPDRRPLDAVRCTLGRTGETDRLYDLGHVTLAVPTAAAAVLLDLGPGRELALLHRGPRAAARAPRRIK